MNQGEAVLAVAVPQEALNVEITAGLFKCVLHFGPADQHSLVMGTWDNVNNQAKIDGQFQFDVKENQATCEEVFGINPTQPAQFEATYVDESEQLEVLNE